MSSLCDYSDAYILVKGKIITGEGDNVDAKRLDERNKLCSIYDLHKGNKQYKNR